MITEPPSPGPSGDVGGRTAGGRWAILLAALLFMVGCGAEPDPSGEPATGETAAGEDAGAPSSMRLEDDEGRIVELPAAPRRIVSLVPSVTEILVALGARGRLAGRTEFDSLPEIASLPSVGGGLEPSLERLVELDPDLVIRFAGPTDRETPDRLDRMGVPHLAVRPDGIDDVRRIVTLLGRVVGEPDRARALLAEMDSSLAATRERVASRERRAVAWVLGGSPPWVAGPDTFVDELVSLAGGRNVFSDLERLYGPVSEELFATRHMDVVLTSSDEELPFLPDDARVERVSPTVETPGIDLARSAEVLARRIHPEAFP